MTLWLIAAMPDSNVTEAWIFLIYKGTESTSTESTILQRHDFVVPWQKLALKRAATFFNYECRGGWGKGYSVGCNLEPHH